MYENKPATPKTKKHTLSRIVLAIESVASKQVALQHILNALQIRFARDCLVAALQPATAASINSSNESQNDIEDKNEQSSTPMPDQIKPVSTGNAPSPRPSSPSISPPSLVTPQQSDVIAEGGGESLACMLEAANVNTSMSLVGSPGSDESILLQLASRASSLRRPYKDQNTDPKGDDESKEDDTEQENNIGSSVVNNPQHMAYMDDFYRNLQLADARVMVDLVKLSVAERLCPEALPCFSGVIGNMCSRNSAIADMILELCITELEEVANDTEALRAAPHPVVQESPHPYTDNMSLQGTVKIPGAEALRVQFSQECSTERRHDPLTLLDGQKRMLCVRSGRDWADWAAEVRITGDEMHWKFNSDSSVNGWGWKFTVFPLMTCSAPRGQYSDRRLLSRPMLEIAMHLLPGVMSTTPNSTVLARIAAALASCSQLSSLAPNHRMWALKTLRQIVTTDMGSGLNIKALLAASYPTQLTVTMLSNNTITPSTSSTRPVSPSSHGNTSHYSQPVQQPQPQLNPNQIPSTYYSQHRCSTPTLLPSSLNYPSLPSIYPQTYSASVAGAHRGLSLIHI